jgi:hypothetical protein
MTSGRSASRGHSDSPPFVELIAVILATRVARRRAAIRQPQDFGASHVPDLRPCDAGTESGPPLQRPLL